MGIIVFLVAAIIECAFAAFCIITKSNHARKRSIIRMASFIGFVLLSILPVIEWGLRYYALASLLLLLAMIEAKALVREKREKREYKAVKVVLRTLGVVLLFFLFTMPAMIFPQDKTVLAVTGKYQVLTQTYTYTDQSRFETYADTHEKRRLNVQLWFPDNLNESVPLIVFSHGGLGVKSSNESLYNELASHGFVVCSIDHAYQSFYSIDKDGYITWIDLGYVQELFAEDSRSDIQQSYEYYQKWMKIRTDDINFVIDYIIAEVSKHDADRAYKLVDIGKIGVMGHSLGGSAALGVGRIRTDVKAVIALESPYMFDIEGVKEGQFVFTDKIYPIPVLNVYSDGSWGILGDRPQYATNYKMINEPDEAVFNAYISGVGHLALTDFALTSPFLTRVLDGKKSTTETVTALRTINRISLDFFNSFLKGEGELTTKGLY